MSSGSREPGSPSSLYKSAVAHGELVYGGHCTHHCVNDVPLEGYCSIHKNEGGSPDGTTAVASLLNGAQTGKSSVPCEYRRDIEPTSEGDSVNCDAKSDCELTDKVQETKDAKAGLPNADSETSIMNILQKVSNIEVSVDFIEASIDDIVERIRSQRHRALPVSVASGTSAICGSVCDSSGICGQSGVCANSGSCGNSEIGGNVDVRCSASDSSTGSGEDSRVTNGSSSNTSVD